MVVRFLESLFVLEGESWQQSLYLAIDNSKCVIALLSNDYLDSVVCNEELYLATAKHLSSVRHKFNIITCKKFHPIFWRHLFNLYHLYVMFVNRWLQDFESNLSLLVPLILLAPLASLASFTSTAPFTLLLPLKSLSPLTSFAPLKSLF